ncbi:MAG: hypothetical protein RBR87_05450 [Bacteroidales bacterium]|jgi:hypothetical protein|nr:hypothetical protein [Bacteroidales bacterium]
MKKFTLFLVLTLAIVSCDKKDDDKLTSGINSYPMNIGTEWVYNRQVIIEKYDSAISNKIAEIDTINFITKVSIDKDTILNDSMNVVLFKSQEDNSSWTSIHYYYMDKEGLRIYAYSNAGAVVFPKKSGCSQFINLYTLVDKRFRTNNEMYFEVPPTLNIELPLENNSVWTYRKPSESSKLQIDKEVVGSESLMLNERSFKCLKVKYIYRYEPVFDGIDITDWISEEGLIKRLTTIDSVAVTDEPGELMYIARITESVTLKDLKIQ